MFTYVIKTGSSEGSNDSLFFYDARWLKEKNGDPLLFFCHPCVDNLKSMISDEVTDSGSLVSLNAGFTRRSSDVLIVGCNSAVKRLVHWLRVIMRCDRWHNKKNVTITNGQAV
ncbi:2117_t:CDS:2 [Acaulospora morrowiae]|uniref:2117_t:CDS:1 n=1 Tax=Acaulospora morrowiae TaxID=94023 RepID=A0A9N9DS12_9GLOM|nr:2117_t:CDS:2 [Acaulospora morrowiae]